MLKIIQNPPTLAIDVYIQACDMKPLQVGQIDDPGVPSLKSFVMRTASQDRLEVLDLSKPGPGDCWTTKESAAFRVRLLRPDEPLIIELRNE